MCSYVPGYISYESSAELQHRHSSQILLQIRQTTHFFLAIPVQRMFNIP